ncbi:unnamed protein product, partial [Ectocarpus sp. 12 AP-2014]
FSTSHCSVSHHRVQGDISSTAFLTAPEVHSNHPRGANFTRHLAWHASFCRRLFTTTSGNEQPRTNVFCNHPRLRRHFEGFFQHHAKRSILYKRNDRTTTNNRYGQALTS